MGWDVLIFAGVGFFAQLIDGALGMAYGVTATSILLHFGTPPAVASASVHAAEAFTTGASGFAHWRAGNVHKELMLRLLAPGIIGGVIGAYVLSSVPGDMIRPVVNLYLLAMGVVIVIRAFRALDRFVDLQTHPVRALAALGGFLDAIGGGGWGPIVTSRLISIGATPRFVIGSVNCAEFFLTVTITATFFATIGLELWPVITGLVLGGIAAAPLGALLVAKLSPRILMIVVGTLVIGLSVFGLAGTVMSIL